MASDSRSARSGVAMGSKPVPKGRATGSAPDASGEPGSTNLGGRPPHQPTDELRRRVAICAGAGMFHEDIAIAIGISRPTLTKHYQFELFHGALAKRADVLVALYENAMKGNVSAQKAYASLDPPKVSAPDPEAPGAGQYPPPPADAKLGKKEQAQIDAKTAHVGTDWDDLLARGARRIPH